MRFPILGPGHNRKIPVLEQNIAATQYSSGTHLLPKVG